ncbi:MAG: hypothetical protein HY814_13005 [Candidatus Riflebacteria bacterium]|nr:hypothetical protein [Candidatus Riflebacteria bacterium]
MLPNPTAALPPRTPPRLFSLLRPQLQMARNFVRSQDWRGIVLVALIAFVVMATLYLVSFRMLTRVDGVAIIGPLLKRYLLSMVLFSLLLMLVFSNIITALSTFYCSHELDMLFASPIGYTRVFVAKFVETTVVSSWMVFGMLLMLLVAYGQSYQSPWYYYPICWLPLVPYCVYASSAGICITLGLARALPVHQTRNILRFMGAVAIGLLVLFLRMLRPEQLMRPEKFRSFTNFLYQLHNPRIEAFPSAWTANLSLEAMGLDAADPGKELLRLFGGAAVAFAFTFWLARRFHFAGWLKFQESGERGRKGGLRWLGFLEGLMGWLSVPTRAILEKDVKVFIRSPVLWTQFLLMVVIVAIYIYNVYLLPLGELAIVHPLLPDFLSFLNIGFIAFIVVACALRFGYPAVSMEGSVFYRIHASPLSLQTYVWIKFWSNFVPLLLIALILVCVSDALLGVRPGIFVLGVLDAALVTLVVSALAIVFGAQYRNFRAENFAQIPSGFGGMVFMVTSLAFVVVFLLLQAYPMWAYYTVWQEMGPHLAPRLAAEHGALQLWMWRLLGFGPTLGQLALGALCLTASVVLCLAIWAYSMRRSERILRYLEEPGG